MDAAHNFIEWLKCRLHDSIAAVLVFTFADKAGDLTLSAYKGGGSGYRHNAAMTAVNGTSWLLGVLITVIPFRFHKGCYITAKMRGGALK